MNGTASGANEYVDMIPTFTLSCTIKADFGR